LYAHRIHEPEPIPWLFAAARQALCLLANTQAEGLAVDPDLGWFEFVLEAEGDG
jgi:hypothetical protein